jgi:hypothetical protein
MFQPPESPQLITNEEEQEEKKVVFEHSKDGLSIYITIYNTNNNANEDSEAGLKQEAETGGQISGLKGRNANQGGQIAGNCGQNANQDGEVESKNCGSAETEAYDAAQPQEPIKASANSC